MKEPRRFQATDLLHGECPDPIFRGGRWHVPRGPRARCWFPRWRTLRMAWDVLCGRADIVEWGA